MKRRGRLQAPRIWQLRDACGVVEPMQFIDEGGAPDVVAAPNFEQEAAAMDDPSVGLAHQTVQCRPRMGRYGFRRNVAFEKCRIGNVCLMRLKAVLMSGYQLAPGVAARPETWPRCRNCPRAATP